MSQYTILNNPFTSSRNFWKDKNSYVTSDPRVRDYTNNSYLKLDRPSYQVTTNGLGYDVYTQKECMPKWFYDNYTDTNAGDYIYYIDHELQTPYPKEVYTIPGSIVPMAYQDPTSALKVEYVKVPTKQAISPYRETHDQINFREDIMALQSIKMNRRKYQLAT
jgi:hypothetical protein